MNDFTDVSEYVLSNYKPEMIVREVPKEEIYNRIRFENEKLIMCGDYYYNNYNVKSIFN